MKKKLGCILLVDDDEATNFLHKIVVQRSECTNHLEVALNGEEALQYLHSAYNDAHPRPDLILLDINMPIMNGWEFLDEYQKLKPEQKSKTVIVMLTTSLNPDDRQRSSEIPEINGFKNKPLDEEVLLNILKEYYPDNF